MAAILKFAILNLTMFDSAMIVFPVKVTHTCQHWFPPFAQKTSLINSDSTWWWKPSWILPCWIETLPSWIQTPCYLLSDSLKNTLTLLCLRIKLIQSDSNSFIFHSTWWWQPSCILPSRIWSIFDSAMIVFPVKVTHTFQDWLPPLAQKNFTQSLRLKLMMAAILNSVMFDSDTAILDSDNLLSFSQIHSKTLSLHSDSDSN